MKIIALYLPQFHRIPENDKWWGDGFTEWVNVKKAKPLFKDHNQPRIPLNDNYYDLSNVEVMRWQSNIAKENGIYGFCFYHYWFDGKLLLEKPIEQFLASKEIDFHYCISWANEHWTNQWVSDEKNVLIEQRYGGEKEWKEHFDYLLKFFKDERYITFKDCPLFLIYRPELIDKRRKMFEYFDELARNEGFPGLCYVFQRGEILLNNKNFDLSMFHYGAIYQPGLTQAKIQQFQQSFKILRKLKKRFAFFLEKHFQVDSRSIALLPKSDHIRFDDYDEVWLKVLNDVDIFPSIIPTAFIDWDNTPRKGKNGSVLKGATPEKFRNYFRKLVIKSKEQYDTDFLFIFAWNEWAEGGYLEPDTLNGFGYLDAIKNVLTELQELPD